MRKAQQQKTKSEAKDKHSYKKVLEMSTNGTSKERKTRQREGLFE